MKLAACYTIFNGLELLEASIAQIIDDVDIVIICYQEISNKGNRSDAILPFISTLNGKNKYKIIRFYPNFSKNTKENERNKHELMLKTARNEGATHFFISACDHFYHSSEVKKAKKAVEESDYDVTFTKMFTYYKNITWQLTPVEDYCMPFIMKISPNTQIINTNQYPIYVDPSVKVSTCEKWFLFDLNDVALHHYSMIRINIMDKFINAAASIRWAPGAAEKYAAEYENYNISENPGISYFGARKIKIVNDFFCLTQLFQ